MPRARRKSSKPVADHIATADAEPQPLDTAVDAVIEHATRAVPEPDDSFPFGHNQPVVLESHDPGTNGTAKFSHGPVSEPTAAHQSDDCQPPPRPPEPPQPDPDAPRQAEPRRGLRHTTTVSVGDDRIHIVDEGHKIGIQLDLADKGATPSNAVREILKAAMHGRRGLDYKPMRGEKPWVKQISDNPVGDRLDNERRHADVVEQHRKDRGMER